MNRRKAVRQLIFAVSLALAPAAQAQEPDDAGAKLLAAASPLGDRVLGQADAPAVMVEYASATCPHCAEFHTNVLPLIKAEYIDSGKLRFIFREFPLDRAALAASMLARCVPDDKYFATIEMAGMDKAGFDACLARPELAKAIIESSRQAARDFAIKGTPAIFVNGEMIDGHKEMADVKAAIDAAISK